MRLFGLIINTCQGPAAGLRLLQVNAQNHHHLVAAPSTWLISGHGARIALLQPVRDAGTNHALEPAAHEYPYMATR